MPAEKNIVPPWEAFPDYERYTIGWRMGGGEEYFHDWWNFIASLPLDFSSRLQYLQQNRPAPINWFDIVLKVLYPEQNDIRYRDRNSEIPQLLNWRLIEYDVAFATWLQQQTEIRYPWTMGNTPEEVARYSTRDFWFFCRQFNSDRTVDIPEIPAAWWDIENNLRSGETGNLVPSQGLQTIAKMLCSGSILTPWQLGLNLDSCKNSYEMDMGYGDAYGLWLTSAFDDDKLIRQMLSKTSIPDEWNDWIEEKTQLISWQW